MLLQENVQECKKEKINQILHKSGCNHESVYDVKMFIMLTERTYYYELKLLCKRLRFEQNVTFFRNF